MTQNNATKTTHYPEIGSNPDFPSLESEVISYWKENKLFEQSVAHRPASKGGNNNEYVFYDGPPFANGLPHHGHLLTGFVKDLFARYHTMKGERTERRFGWDCHGLPAEMGAEKELNISGRKNIAEFGIGNFNDHCRRSVMQYRDQWEWYVNRQARWVDFENDYKTMDTPFMESVIWAFSELYKKGYIYEGFKVMPYSWAAETVLSTSEIRLDDATREKEDKAVTVAFKLKEKPAGAPDADNYYVLAWTTTPWTLPSNLALAVHKEFFYYKHYHEGRCYIATRAAINALFGTDYKEVVGDVDEKGDVPFHPIRGDQLLGLTYEPLFPYFADTKNAFRILDGSSFIEEGSGTGVVHMAPGFGEDDQRVCADNGIEPIVPVNGEGRYTDAIYDLPAVTIRHPVGGEAAAQDLKDSVQSLRDSQNDTYIQTRRCILRRPTAEDEAHFVALHTNEAVMKTMNDGPMTQAEAKDDFAKNLAHFEAHGYGQWAVFCRESGAFVGRAGLSFMAQSSEMPEAPTLRCCLNEAFWHGGYGSELCFAALWFGFSQKQFDSIVAGAHPDNPRAISMMTRLGMQIEKQVMFKRMQGPYFRIHKAEFDALNPPLILRGLNVIKETKLKSQDEPYKQEQLEKYGLANLRIIAWLKQRGQLIRQDDFKHNYPHCWRTDQPIIYMAMSSWFVDVPQFRGRMVELNQGINWIPDHIKDGRFGKWLENAREWSISRSRFWGCPIPVWRAPSGKIKVFGSIAELEAASGQKITDLHRPFIDEIVIHEGGETYTRVEDVFDCWFESGSMPYAQVHYPFENKEWFESHFPADFIVEYEAQTRGWFYSMMVLSVALFDRIPFKNCICHGVVLDESGRKLSKKLQNYMDPKILFDQFGSDALRWFMMASPIMRGSELLLDAKGQFIHDAIRLYIKPIWNAYSFFTLYANADGAKAQFNTTSDNLMDRYILAKCAGMVQAAGAALDAYDTPAACVAITEFVEVLNNWYIRRNKDRFWSSDRNDADKQAAYDTLYSVLHILCRVVAPLLPMVSEAIFMGLHGVSSCGQPKAGAQDLRDSAQSLRDSQNDEVISVHLADWPDVSDFVNNNQVDRYTIEGGKIGLLFIEHSMDKVRAICNAALSIRNENNIRVRQPLSKITVYTEQSTVLTGDFSNRPEVQDFYKNLISDEVNVKEIIFSTEITKVASKSLVVNSRIAGKRIGTEMKSVIPASKNGDWEILEFNSAGFPTKARVGNTELINTYFVNEDGSDYEFEIKLVQKEGVVGAQALSSNDALVVLDLEITPELKAEGLARDVVRLIQQARKDADLNVADRITLHIEADGEVAAAIAAHADYICAQTLTTQLEFGAADGAAYTQQAELEGEAITLHLSVSQKAAA